MADNGTLWLDCPSVGGPSPDIPVDIQGQELRYFRRHSSVVRGAELPWVAASGVEGPQRIILSLEKDPKVSRAYTVRAHFMEPLDISPGQRVFSLTVNDSFLAEEIDIIKEAGGMNRAVVKECRGVMALDELQITLKPLKGKTLLCGIELVAEDP